MFFDNGFICTREPKWISGFEVHTLNKHTALRTLKITPTPAGCHQLFSLPPRPATMNDLRTAFALILQVHAGTRFGRTEQI
jgi:hypothetical protein